VKPATACREANYSRDTINIREDSRSRDSKHIMNVNSRRTTRIRQYESKQHSAGTPATAAELKTGILATVWWTAPETIGASQTSTAEGRPLTTTLETPTGRPTPTEMPQILWMPTTLEFLQKFMKNLSELQKICEKRCKKSKNCSFLLR
jgi:hypothetical protein